MAVSAEGPASEDELHWRRPHPFTIVIEIGSALRQVAIALFAVGGGFLDAGSLLEIAVVAAPLMAAIGRWYTTRYALGTESVHYRYGLLRRRKQVLPRANVQNVSTRAGLVARVGSVVELHISDASSSGDIRLRLVSKEEADRLATILRSDIDRHAGVVETDASQPDAVESAIVHPATGEPNTGESDSTGLDQTVASGAPVGQPVWREPTIEPAPASLLRAELTSLGSLAAIGSAVGAMVALYVLTRIGDLRALDTVGPSLSAWALSYRSFR